MLLVSVSARSSLGPGFPSLRTCKPVTHTHTAPLTLSASFRIPAPAPFLPVFTRLCSPTSSLGQKHTKAELYLPVKTRAQD